MATYTIPLRADFIKVSPKKKTPRAVRALKGFVIKHTKADTVKIGPSLNAAIWAKGLTNPPARVRVDVTLKDGVAKVELEGVPYAEPIKQEEKKPETLKDKIASKVLPKKEAPAPAQDAPASGETNSTSQQN